MLLRLAAVALLWIVGCKREQAVAPPAVPVLPSAQAPLPQLAAPPRPAAPPPAAPEPVAPPPPAPVAVEVEQQNPPVEDTTLYQWVNAAGTTEFANGLGSVPAQYRAKARRVGGEVEVIGRSVQATSSTVMPPSWRDERVDQAGGGQMGGGAAAPEPAEAQTGEEAKNELGETAHDFALRSAMGRPIAPEGEQPQPEPAGE